MINNLEKRKKTNLIIGWIVFAAINLIIILTTLLVKSSQHKIPWSGQAWLDAFLFLLNKIYLDNFFKLPAVLLGSLTFIGYLVIGRGLRESIIGFLKTVIGFILLQIGSGTLVSLAKPVFDGISKISGSSVGIVPLDPYFSLASQQNFFSNKDIFGNNSYVSLISFSFILGFAINIIMVALKKWTNTNSLMITGRIMLQQAAVVTAIFYVILFQDLRIFDGTITFGEQTGLVIISGLFLGIYWATASTSTIKGTNAVTQNAGFAIGHQQMWAITASYKLGKYLGNKEDSAEHKKLPSYLKIFEDNIFTQTIIILSLFLTLFIVLIAVDPTKVIEKDLIKFTKDYDIWNKSFGGANFTLNIIGGSLKIVASLIAIITGVRMFITELQQSFHGISEKIIPGAVVAVDVAAVYGFSINSVTFGFLSGVIGQFLGVALVIALSLIPGQNVVFIGIPLFITLFFNSGSLGVYANASGGWKAALLLPGIIGFLEILIISFASRALFNGSANNLSPLSGGYIGMADWNLFFGLLFWFSSYHFAVAWILVILAIITMILIGMIVDNGSQTKATFLQKILKINPVLLPENK
ncbi:PTS ascorbate transporter subunit IIC [Mycoplasmopsis cynos]|uniref:PTS ascorbate transporter subunit IIC n=1 Tax=Mycoplasmopsis cynos TaxID=171284 RepID=UPI00220968FC|nr:PTS ascorbate transporter subunit IIC [Mycoplasmopsis cynos]UWV80834.1 PTS ascorbate transporter subunit IIC [Mycoplasmopsis cynos]